MSDKAEIEEYGHKRIVCRFLDWEDIFPDGELPPEELREFFRKLAEAMYGEERGDGK